MDKPMASLYLNTALRGTYKKNYYLLAAVARFFLRVYMHEVSPRDF
jgi:hypothetical protein